MFSILSRRVLLPLVILLAGTPSLRAGFQLLWEIGTDDNPIQDNFDPRHGFSWGNENNGPAPGQVTRLPGDPLYDPANNPAADDDFYEAGIYPAGFNGLTNQLDVPNAEPDSAFEALLTNFDLTNRIHFIADGSQAGPLSRFRLSFELDLGAILHQDPANSLELGFGQHNIVVRLKNSAGGTTLMSRMVDRRTPIVIDFNAIDAQVQAGPNTIEIVRDGPNPTNTLCWVELDYVKLSVHTNALMDADGDGLPRWWEEENGLSDTDPTDAASDRDHDGLTALQEYNGGINSTDPNRADTDGDGLTDGEERALGTDPNNPDTDEDGTSDGEEVRGWPRSNPLLADSDGDGASDSFERRVGTDPMDPASVPTVWRGGIGIHFVSQLDLGGSLGTNETAGIVPQTRWNETVPLRTSRNALEAVGSKAAIALPVPGQFVRSDGLVLTNFIVTWNGEASYATRNNGSSDARLMDGFLRAQGATVASMTLSHIPFKRYDLYVLVGGSEDGQFGRIRLGNKASNDRYFKSMSTAFQGNFVEIKPGLTNFQRGNFVRYANLSAPVASLMVTNCNGFALGIHAIQIIDATLDSDKSGIPDWWEMKNALEPGSKALAAADSDGDGLSNLKEYRLGTDPHKADTDGDGLTDGQEVALHTNPLLADTDGDGLSDGSEVHGLLPSNPKLADSNRNGVNDYQESLKGNNPASKSPKTPVVPGVPFYKSKPASWDWTFDNAQFVWNHFTGGLAPDLVNEDHLAVFSINNPALAGVTFSMDLRYVRGTLSYLFLSNFGAGFSYPGLPGVSIVAEETAPVAPDLRNALGFSGYGRTDISDRLRFQLRAQRAATSNSWIVTFEIRNLTSNAVVIARSYTNCSAAAGLDQGQGVWTDNLGVTNHPEIKVHQGVQLYFSPAPLSSLPAFADAKDSDKDGMPDVWEDAHGFNKFSAADAVQDADGDGLNNRDEFLAGTDPHNPDTDGDGVSDGDEVAAGSNPLDPKSRPEVPGAVGVVTRVQAARLLQQATFGATSRELDRVVNLGFDAWINDQMSNQPPTFHRRYIEKLYEDLNGSHTDASYLNNRVGQRYDGWNVDGKNATTPFARAAIGAPDQLRQRVAFALSQMLVVSRRDPNLNDKPMGVLDFYDIFVRNAFGSYYDILREVAFHPVMGRYLGHLGNTKAQPELNQYPDENFAREVMQLFSIGLWQLNNDGTRKLDGLGHPIPTYDNSDITELARVFTGFWFGGQNWGHGGQLDKDHSVPMAMAAEKHDFGAKTLLGGYFVPERAPTADNAVADVEDALMNLFDHPNNPPFISRQLIQFLVTSNPSSNYVGRVAAIFINDGAGRRGDLAAVVRAILLDHEARDPAWFQDSTNFGRLKDPLQRAMAIGRVGKLASYTNLVWWTAGQFYDAALQEPTYSPTVFNFYRPDYQPPGLLTQYGLAGPAFQITDSYSCISFPDKLWEISTQGFLMDGYYSFPLDYSDLVRLAGSPSVLVDQVNLLFCAGSMSDVTRTQILNALQQVPSYDPLARARLAVYLAASCPEGAVQR